MMRRIVTSVLAGIILTACSSGILINVTFENPSGIEKGDRVFFQGNAAGRVTGVQLDKDGIYTVQLEIDKGFANAVTEYAQFHLVNDTGKNGPKGIEIQLEREGGAPLASGSTVIGVSPEKGLAARIQEELEAGLGFFKKQIDQFSRDVESFPESQAYKDLKTSLEELASEIERKEKQTREKVKRKWLPQIQRELDDLRERLKQMGREDELEPLDHEMERLRKI